MATIDNLIEVNITQETTAVAVDSFSVPLIVGETDTSSEWGTDVTRAYTSPSAMLADGFTSSSPEYVAAVAMSSGSTKPSEFYVGKRTTGAIADDLNAIFAENNTPYGVILAGLPESDIEPAATAIEAMTKILLASTQDTAVAATGDTDLGSALKAKGFNRTGLIYTPANTGGVLEAAWMGSDLPATPGSNTWAYTQLAGITADKLTDNQRANLYGVPNQAIAGKNVNVYQSVAGVNITFPGMMASGRYIDLTIGADWLQANVQAAVYQALVSAAKVPYTNAGVAFLINQINGVLQTAVTNGLLDNTDSAYPIYCTAPNVDTVSSTQRANRIAPTITFGGKLQGAIQSAIIKGVVAV